MLSTNRRALSIAVVTVIILQLVSCHGFFTGPTLTSINVTPSTPSVVVNGTQQFTANGVNDDGSTANVTATWASSDRNVATIDPNGLATAHTAGTSTITATATSSSSVSGSTTMTVTTAALTSITVTDTTGGTISVIGGTDQFHATANFADGTTQDVTSTATWTSGQPGIASITSPGGLATGITGGSTVIVASVGNVTSQAFTLSVL